MENPYLPRLARIVNIVDETPDIKTFATVFEDGEENFAYQAGQFVELSVFGIGEAPFGVASAPSQSPPFEFTVKEAGKVTSALLGLSVGNHVGIRGPYGNRWPVEVMMGKNLIFIGGGVGLPPLRTLIDEILYGGERSEYGNILIIYGARSPADLVYKEQLQKWQETGETEVKLTVDEGDEQWSGPVGFVPSFLMDIAPSPENAVALTVGPPIMIKFVLQNLLELGFEPSQIFTNLESRMKCGIGKCGRCNIGPYYVCTDGPIFSYEQIQQMPQDF